jgi:hypothetical protein
MTSDEKKRQFEEDIIKMSVEEYYKYVDKCNEERPNSKVRSEKESEVFYYAMRLGVIRGINYATNQYVQSLKNFEEQKEKENK